MGMLVIMHITPMLQDTHIAVLRPESIQITLVLISDTFTATLQPQDIQITILSPRITLGENTLQGQVGDLFIIEHKQQEQPIQPFGGTELGPHL